MNKKIINKKTSLSKKLADQKNGKGCSKLFKQNEVVKSILTKDKQRKKESCDNVVTSLSKTKKGATIATDSIGTKGVFVPNIPLEYMGKFRNTYIGWDACAIIAQNVWVGRAIEQPVKDALSPSYNFVNSDLKSENTLEQSELKQLKIRVEKEFQLTKRLKENSIVKRKFGWSFVVPVFKNGQEPDMSVPFNPQAIKKGSFEGIRVVEPRWIMPHFSTVYNTDPLSKYFYEPIEYRTFNGKTIHHTWLRKFVHIDVGDILKPVYMYGGISIPQLIYERVYAAERVADEVPLLVLTKRTFIADAELANYMAQPEEVENRLQALVTLRDNFGIFVKDIGTEVSQIDTNLSNLEEVINSQYYLVAAIAEVPVSKFLKTPIKGMNATGKAEADDYNQSLIRFQNEDFKPVIDFVIELMGLSDRKEYKIEAEFNELSVPTAREQAEINDISVANIVQLIQLGVIDAEEARMKIRTDKRSGFSWLPKEIPPQAQKMLESMIKTNQQRDLFGRFRSKVNVESEEESEENESEEKKDKNNS